MSEYKDNSAEKLMDLQAGLRWLRNRENQLKNEITRVEKEIESIRRENAQLLCKHLPDLKPENVVLLQGHKSYWIKNPHPMDDIGNRENTKFLKATYFHQADSLEPIVLEYCLNLWKKYIIHGKNIIDLSTYKTWDDPEIKYLEGINTTDIAHFWWQTPYSEEL